MLKSFAQGQLFGATYGDDAPASVLALHGWRRSHQDFSQVLENPPTGVGAIALDLYGFGATPAPPEAWGTEEYAARLATLFDEPGLLAPRVTVVGHSFGGRVAVRLAQLVPDRIDRLVLTGVPLLDREGRRSTPAAAYRLVRTLHQWGVVGDERMEAMRQKYGSPDYRAAQGTMRGVFVKVLAESYASELGAISAPVELVWGANDTEVPLEVAERARPLFAQATLDVLPGVGHLTPTEAPGSLRTAIFGTEQ